MALIDKLKAIANAIRAKTGKSDSLTLDQMPTEIASIETGSSGGGEVNTITGSFSPSASSGTYQVEIPKLPRAVFVYATDISDTIDRYELHSWMMVNPNPVLANGNSVHVAARYKSSTSSGTTLSQGTNFNTYTYNSSYTGTSASAYQYSVCVTSSKVYFKQAGNYRFRVGVTYNYYIVFD